MNEELKKKVVFSQIESDSILQDKISRRFEKQLSSDLIKLFSTIAISSKEHYLKNLTINSIGIYQEDLQKLLLNHYVKIAHLFSRFLRSHDNSKKNLKSYLDGHRVDKKSEEEVNYIIDQTNLSINDELESWLINHSYSNSRAIIQTAQKRLDRSYQEAIIESRMSEIDHIKKISNRNKMLSEVEDHFSETFEDSIDAELIAALATDFFLDYYDTHVDSIAQVEVGEVSEHSKLVEATILASSILITDTIIGTFVDKTWWTMDDDRVRATHRPLHKETIPYDELYIVGGDLMMYPKDMAYGASLSEIINCRCQCQYTVI